jgi:hypothetical protein
MFVHLWPVLDDFDPELLAELLAELELVGVEELSAFLSRRSQGGDRPRRTLTGGTVTSWWTTLESHPTL